MKSILDYDTVALDEITGKMLIIDQTLLPNKMEVVYLSTQEEIWRAINILQVRGAPAIGVAAAIGLYMAARDISSNDMTVFVNEFRKAKAYLATARPTAVNLFWALNRMEEVVYNGQGKWSVPQLVERLHQEAVDIHDEDIWVCKQIGEFGLSLVKPNDGLLTHCNAGKLATVQYGTATAPMYLGQDRGYKFKIFSDETRPLLQGARLTSFELKEAGLDVTVICDNMAATVMKKGWIDAIFVGCDRIAANGDTANKIGTSAVAIIAKYYHVPVYICAPTSTIDLDTPTGENIKIEERKPEEVSDMWYKQPMAPKGVKIFNPAFDVTDHELIAGIVTEYGVARPPYNQSFKRIFELKRRHDEQNNKSRRE